MTKEMTSGFVGQGATGCCREYLVIVGCIRVLLGFRSRSGFVYGGGKRGRAGWSYCRCQGLSRVGVRVLVRVRVGEIAGVLVRVRVAVTEPKVAIVPVLAIVRVTVGVVVRVRVVVGVSEIVAEGVGMREGVVDGGGSWVPDGIIVKVADGAGVEVAGGLARLFSWSKKVKMRPCRPISAVSCCVQYNPFIVQATESSSGERG